MGPAMNLLLARRAHGASCCIRAPTVRPTRIEPPVVVGVGQPDSAGAQAGIQPGDRITVGGRSRRGTRGSSSRSRSAPARTAKCDSVCCATASRSRARSRRCRRRAEPLRDRRTSACCRTCHPHIRSVSPGERRRARGTQGRRRRVSPSTAEPITFALAAEGGDRQAAGRADHDGDSARRRADDHRWRRRTARRDRGWLGIGIVDETRRASSRAALGADRAMSVEKNVRVRRHDLPDRLGTRHARDVAEAVDGARRDRAALRRIGAARLDRPAQR